ncbi:MAG: Tfp pilus assembly protein FimT/FimU [Wenzhouxiangellaceae bacterium]
MKACWSDTHSRGFTVTEALIVLSVIALLMALALPQMQGQISTQRLEAQADELVAAINLARSEALSRGVFAGACPSADGLECATSSWQQGWLVWADANGDNRFTPGEAVRVNHPIQTSTGTLVTSSGSISNGITFNPMGITTMAGPNANITLSHAGARYHRQIQISQTGFISRLIL